MRILFLCILVLTLLPFSLRAQKPLVITSPDNQLRVEVVTSPALQYRIRFREQDLTGFSKISMTLENGTVLGRDLKGAVKTREVRQQVKPLYGISNSYEDRFREMSIQGKLYSVTFRVYNDAVAYRFETRFAGDITVKDEQVELSILNDPNAYLHTVPRLEHSYEQNYAFQKISAFDSSAITSLPILLDYGKAKVLVTEADLLDYPGLHLVGDGSGVLTGRLAAVVKETKLSGWNSIDYDGKQKFVNYNQFAKSHENMIAKTKGTRTFPWRVCMIKEQVKDLMNSPIVYLLAAESKLTDQQWIKPGKVAWDWWCAANLSGVNFKAGYNTATFKYYIDFAARNNIAYVNMDEWWSDQADLLKVSEALDMEEITRYAREKKVGLFLWCIWHVLDRQMIEALDQFEKWGIAGIKVDFMDRDDQYAVNFYERVAKEAAKRKILVNFHGAMKPTGLERTYPNVINRESVLGLEYNKFSAKCTPRHSVTIPFIRMAVGSMDYTPGAMYNGTQESWRQVNLRPMSMSTRVQQLAMFVVYYAPLQMLADAPTEYEREPAILKYLSEVPVTWDETRALAGEPGEFVALARRKGNQWYIGAMNNETPRQVSVDISALTNGKTIEIRTFEDGVNADRLGTDYKAGKVTVEADGKLTLSMASGGGWVGIVQAAP